MVTVARESVDISRNVGSSRHMKSMRVTVAEMRSAAAHYRRMAEETRSTIANTRTSIRYLDTLLHELMFQFRLISINQVLPSPAIVAPEP